ncbi:lipoprotein signal peptidase [Euzebyella marina]|uniref:Lipoprotein signal peptidase n=1 Tax=Euzebyella marina TaxID=1761453 RepID=A0A3G2LB81_9FLAO|nr:lipoprotein signal peptidase [Euzebyella marina]AYN69507.1 lipoprotein signal peptidase [Euzebyella marina]MAU71359.1 lipoprotein signal peptidase [Pseudozobellia sp.]MBG46759.1 lipoprotein signal peptidase [Pseudozobellia sp.]|tara:strand:- start:1175011 stop:1175676 length:666 start_codon:yes stop_codon:yes gene_type:complete
MGLKKSLVLIIAVLLVDQISKVYIKTNFVLGESIEVFSWFKILFIENSGAAWGAKLSDFLPVSEPIGKLILTVFRLFAVAGIGYWLFDTIKKQTSKVLILAVSLIFAGALGNIIDSVFYGVVFNDSYQQVATAFSAEPYGSLFYGKVVDMLYFPMIDTTWPDWVPGLGGKDFRFFEPVFNIADMAISTGVGILIVFNKQAFSKIDEKEEDATVEVQTSEKE